MTRAISFILASLMTSFYSVVDAIADTGGGYGYGGHMGWGSGSGMMLFGPIMMIGLVVIIVLAVVMLMRGGGVHSRGGAGSSARALLDERYARGEIDHEEYEQRKRRLTG